MKFVITNMVRRTETRVARARSATRARPLQRICGNKFRLVRGKNRGGIVIDEDLLNEHWDELKEKQAAGLIAVHEGVYNGPLFAFDSLDRQVVENTPEPAEEPSDDESEDEEQAADDSEEEAEELEEEEAELEEEPEEEMTAEPEKPVERMNKAELIAHAAVILGEDEGALEALTKKQIMERLG